MDAGGTHSRSELDVDRSDGVVSIRMVQNTAVVSLAGDVDSLTVPQARAAILRLLCDPVDDAMPNHGDAERLPAPPAAVIVDLSAVTFLGSSGLALLVECTNTAQRTGQQLRVVTGQGRVVLRPLAITAMSELLALFPDLDSALASAPVSGLDSTPTPTAGANPAAGRDAVIGSALDTDLEDTA